MSPNGLLMTVIAASMMGVSTMLLRAAVDTMGGFGSSNGLIADILALAFQPLLIIGLVIYGSATLIWLRVLSTEPLGIGYPILVSLAFMIVSIGAVVVFGEQVTPTKLLGVGVILLGVIILANS